MRETPALRGGVMRKKSLRETLAEPKEKIPNSKVTFYIGIWNLLFVWNSLAYSLCEVIYEVTSVFDAYAEPYEGVNEAIFNALISWY